MGHCCHGNYSSQSKNVRENHRIKERRDVLCHNCQFCDITQEDRTLWTPFKNPSSQVRGNELAMRTFFAMWPSLDLWLRSFLNQDDALHFLLRYPEWYVIVFFNNFGQWWPEEDKFTPFRLYQKRKKVLLKTRLTHMWPAVSSVGLSAEGGGGGGGYVLPYCCRSQWKSPVKAGGVGVCVKGQTWPEANHLVISSYTEVKEKKL